MVVSVNSIENLVRGYVLSTIQAKYPHLDVTENSSFDDLFVKPMVDLLTPLFEKLNTSALMNNLDNAEYMSEEELDQLIEGNYLKKRNRGNKAFTTITMSFEELDSEGEIENLVIPEGIIVRKKSDGAQYRVTQEKVFTHEDLLLYYNPTTATCDVPVEIEAVDVGEEYNAEVGEINECITLFNTSLVKVSNPSAVDTGTDKETNVEYANRTKEYYISRYLGTDPGYKSFIQDNFEEVEDVYVVGRGDPNMNRDIVKVWDENQKAYIDKHIGGMVDIYIKGCLYVIETTSISLQTNKLVLSKNYDSILPDTISVINDTDSTKSPIVLSKEMNETEFGTKMIITLDNTGEQSYVSDSQSQIYVTYDYKDSNTGFTLQQIDVFTVGISKADLDTPIIKILSLQDEKDSIIKNSESYYTLEKSGTEGTTDERCSITLKNFDNKLNGSVINVNYILNSTLKSLKSVFEQKSYRIITTDIMCLEAIPVYLNVGFGVKLKEGFMLNDSRIDSMKSTIVESFKNRKMGESINEYDIIDCLMKDPDIKEFLEYVALPLDSFYITDNLEAPIEKKRDGTQISIDGTKYFTLNKIQISSY